MQLSDVFLGLGEERVDELVRSMAVGKLKTYQIFERVKTRLHVHKLNAEALKKAGPRVWARLGERDEDFATDIAQGILVSHLDMIKAVLDHLGVAHEDGFFAKDAKIAESLPEGWQQSVYDQFHATYAPAALLFYINHLAWEVAKAEELFQPAA